MYTEGGCMKFEPLNGSGDTYTLESALRVCLQRFDDPNDAMAEIAKIFAALLGYKTPEELEKLLSSIGRHDWVVVR